MIWNSYKEQVKALSLKIVDAQRPIRILDSIKWDAYIISDLKKHRFKELPKVGPEYYAGIELGFDPEAKITELQEIRGEIRTILGAEDAVGQLLEKMTEEYIDVVEMIKHRGTPGFWKLSKKLYGSPKDLFFDGKNTISDLGRMLYAILSKIDVYLLGGASPEDISAEKTVEILNERLRDYFGEDSIRAKLSDGIVADASAGGDFIKIKESTLFSKREIDILEVHEGWVHVGTAQNGIQQHVAKWLSKGPPRCASTQEGLAIIMEIFTFRSFPKRARQINDRIIGIDKVEDGANFLELIEYYRTEGYSEDECIYNAVRVFRGGVVTGGAPFTKDLSYCRGFIENYNFMRAAIRAGRPYLVPFLFAGKLNVDDVPLLYQKYKEGIVDPPKFLPPQFRDMNGIAVWMSFSSFLNIVDLDKVQEHYDRLFKTYL